MAKLTTLLVRLPMLVLRRVWPGLFTVGLGLLAGITLACTVPLLAYTSLTLSLRHTLGQPYRTAIVVASAITPHAASDIPALTPTVTAALQAALGRYLAPQSDLSLRSADFALAGLPRGAQTGAIHFKAFPPGYIATQFPLMQGRLPDPQALANEILLSQQTALALHLHIGDVIAFHPTSAPQQHAATIPVRVVGIIAPQTGDILDPFNTEPIDPVSGGGTTTYAAVLPDVIFERMLDVPTVPQPVQVTWAYALDVSQVTEHTFTDIADRLQTLPLSVTQTLYMAHGANTDVYDNAISILQGYEQRIATTQTPLTALLIQMLLLIVLFLLTSMEQLIESHLPFFAVLRSRGASARQLSVALLLPCVVVGLVCVVVGTPLAVLLTSVVASALTTPTQVQPIIAPLLAQFGQVYADVRWYDVGIAAALVVILATIVPRTLSANVLTVRREAARTTGQSAWQKYHLDTMLALVALGLYLAYIVYLGSFANPDTYAVLAPYAVYAPLLLLVAGTSLLLRLLPWLLRRVLALAARLRGIVPLLTAAQMVQARHKTLQVTLFLALAIASATFVFTFQASQRQHNQDYAAFQVGADFSGALPIQTTTVLSVQQQEDRFDRIPGVQAASVGAIIDIHSDAATAQSLPPLRLMAVDATTYAQVGTWPNPTGLTLADATAQLVAGRADAVAQGAVPTIVDDALWQTLHLADNNAFTLDLSGTGTLKLHSVALAHVAHLPMITDMPGYTASAITGGMLVDFPTLAAAIQTRYPTQAAPPGYVWLKTAQDPAYLAAIRAQLHQAPYSLAGFLDRAQLVADGALDPLDIAITGVTSLGVAMALLLALLITFQVFRETAHKRLLNLTMLAALGARRAHVASILALEDGTLLVLAAILGIVLGVQLAGATVPLITFAQAGDTQQPFIALLVPPARTVVQGPLLAVGIGLFIGLAGIGLGLIVWRAMHTAKGAILRLNED